MATTNTTKKTVKNTKTAKPMTLSKFLSVVKKPELCDAGRWFSKNKNGTYSGACPIGKAATKRGFKFKGGNRPIAAIAARFNVPYDQLARFAHEWDTRIINLKNDHRATALPGKRKSLANIDLTTHELRVAFKETLKSASNRSIPTSVTPPTITAKVVPTNARVR